MAATSDKPDRASILAGFGDQARAHQLAPLWEFFKDWFGGEPSVGALPYRWRYDELRPLLDEAASVITAEEAERRVLALENPGLAGQHLATDSLYAGLQMILPGEIAPSHRHSPAALRFIIEGRGAYTAVSGEKAYMEPGDFIVTPAWAWHEHGNESDGPTVWLDVLDVAMVRFFGAVFAERYSERHFPERRPPGDSRLRYGRNMRPVGEHDRANASPIFSYPYAETREVLERLRYNSDWDAHHGLKMEYIDPSCGAAAIPTMSTFMQLLPKGFKTRPYKCTSGAVFSVVEGHGKVTIGSGEDAARFDYQPRDIWAVPSWQPMTIEAIDESFIFSASDRVVQEKLGLWREQRD